jgi:hypothetical protein
MSAFAVHFHDVCRSFTDPREKNTFPDSNSESCRIICRRVTSLAIHLFYILYGHLLILFFSKASSGSSSKPLPSLNRLLQPGKKQRKVFKCAKCAKMFLSIDHLQKHMQVCNEVVEKVPVPKVITIRI